MDVPNFNLDRNALDEKEGEVSSTSSTIGSSRRGASSFHVMSSNDVYIVSDSSDTNVTDHAGVSRMPDTSAPTVHRGTLSTSGETLVSDVANGNLSLKASGLFSNIAEDTSIHGHASLEENILTSTTIDTGSFVLGDSDLGEESVELLSSDSMMEVDGETAVYVSSAVVHSPELVDSFVKEELLSSRDFNVYASTADSTTLETSELSNAGVPLPGYEEVSTTGDDLSSASTSLNTGTIMNVSTSSNEYMEIPRKLYVMGTLSHQNIDSPSIPSGNMDALRNLKCVRQKTGISTTDTNYLGGKRKRSTPSTSFKNVSCSKSLIASISKEQVNSRICLSNSESGVAGKEKNDSKVVSFMKKIKSTSEVLNYSLSCSKCPELVKESATSYEHLESNVDTTLENQWNSPLKAKPHWTPQMEYANVGIATLKDILIKPVECETETVSSASLKSPKSANLMFGSKNNVDLDLAVLTKGLLETQKHIPSKVEITELDNKTPVFKTDFHVYPVGEESCKVSKLLIPNVNTPSVSHRYTSVLLDSASVIHEEIVNSTKNIESLIFDAKTNEHSFTDSTEKALTSSIKCGIPPSSEFESVNRSNSSTVQFLNFEYIPNTSNEGNNLYADENVSSNALSTVKPHTEPLMNEIKTKPALTFNESSSLEKLNFKSSPVKLTTVKLVKPIPSSKIIHSTESPILKCGKLISNIEKSMESHLEPRVDNPNDLEKVDATDCEGNKESKMSGQFEPLLQNAAAFKIFNQVEVQSFKTNEDENIKTHVNIKAPAIIEKMEEKLVSCSSNSKGKQVVEANDLVSKSSLKTAKTTFKPDFEFLSSGDKNITNVTSELPLISTNTLKLPKVGLQMDPLKYDNQNIYEADDGSTNLKSQTYLNKLNFGLHLRDFKAKKNEGVYTNSKDLNEMQKLELIAIKKMKFKDDLEVDHTSEAPVQIALGMKELKVNIPKTLKTSDLDTCYFNQEIDEALVTIPTKILKLSKDSIPESTSQSDVKAPIITNFNEPENKFKVFMDDSLNTSKFYEPVTEEAKHVLNILNQDITLLDKVSWKSVSKFNKSIPSETILGDEWDNAGAQEEPKVEKLTLKLKKDVAKSVSCASTSGEFTTPNKVLLLVEENKDVALSSNEESKVNKITLKLKKDKMKSDLLEAQINSSIEMMPLKIKPDALEVYESSPSTVPLEISTPKGEPASERITLKLRKDGLKSEIFIAPTLRDPSISEVLIPPLDSNQSENDYPKEGAAVEKIMLKLKKDATKLDRFIVATPKDNLVIIQSPGKISDLKHMDANTYVKCMEDKGIEKNTLKPKKSTTKSETFVVTFPKDVKNLDVSIPLKSDDIRELETDVSKEGFYENKITLKLKKDATKSDVFIATNTSVPVPGEFIDQNELNTSKPKDGIKLSSLKLNEETRLEKKTLKAKKIESGPGVAQEKDTSFSEIEADPDYKLEKLTLKLKTDSRTSDICTGGKKLSVLDNTGVLNEKANIRILNEHKPPSNLSTKLNVFELKARDEDKVEKLTLKFTRDATTSEVIAEMKAPHTATSSGLNKMTGVSRIDSSDNQGGQADHAFTTKVSKLEKITLKLKKDATTSEMILRKSSSDKELLHNSMQNKEQSTDTNVIKLEKVALKLKKIELNSENVVEQDSRKKVHSHIDYLDTTAGLTLKKIDLSNEDNKIEKLTLKIKKDAAKSDQLSRGEELHCEMTCQEANPIIGEFVESEVFQPQLKISKLDNSEEIKLEKITLTLKKASAWSIKKLGHKLSSSLDVSTQMINVGDGELSVEKVCNRGFSEGERIATNSNESSFNSAVDLEKFKGESQKRLADKLNNENEFKKKRNVDIITEPIESCKHSSTSKKENSTGEEFKNTNLYVKTGVEGKLKEILSKMGSQRSFDNDDDDVSLILSPLTTQLELAKSHQTLKLQECTASSSTTSDDIQIVKVVNSNDVKCTGNGFGKCKTLKGECHDEANSMDIIIIDDISGNTKSTRSLSHAIVNDTTSEEAPMNIEVKSEVPEPSIEMAIKIESPSSITIGPLSSLKVEPPSSVGDGRDVGKTEPRKGRGRPRKLILTSGGVTDAIPVDVPSDATPADSTPVDATPADVIPTMATIPRTAHMARPKRTCRGRSRAVVAVKEKKIRNPAKGRKRKLESEMNQNATSNDKPKPAEGGATCYEGYPTSSISTVQVFEEETRMSAESSSRSQTPARSLPSTVMLTDGPGEESQGSAISSATTESVKKKGRLEVADIENKEFSVDQIAEYQWPPDKTGEHIMIQEQISEYLGVKSFKRKYPDLKRRPVEPEERTYLREKGLVTESMCDLGLTAVNSSEVLDIMYTDFQEKYEEYRRFMRECQAKEFTTKQKVATSVERNKLDYKDKAVRSAATWNATFNRTRKDERRCCFDLQSFTIHFPQSRTLKMCPKELPKVGHYPIPLTPGQYADYYKRYTPIELRYFPLNTVLYGPMKPNERHEPALGSDGSQSDSDDDSSSDDSSTTSSGATQDTEESESTAGDLDPENIQEQEQPAIDMGDDKPKDVEKDEFTCKVCSGNRNKNKDGQPELLIHCAQCTSSGHPSCLDLTLDMVPHIKRYDWQCTDCKTCIQCKDPADEDKMLFCDMCDRGYHIYCVGLRRVPSGRWHCKECAVCGSCGTHEPGGSNMDTPNAQWQHEYRKGEKGAKIYTQTLCVPCSKML